MSNSALVHWLFLASNLAYDWRISASLVSTNWLYLVMLQCIWSSVVPLARTLLASGLHQHGEGEVEPDILAF